jgi:hypothetical protein
MKLSKFLFSAIIFYSTNVFAQGYTTAVLLKFTQPIQMSARDHVDSYGPAFKFPKLDYATGAAPMSRDKVEHPSKSRSVFEDTIVVTLNNQPGDINFQSKADTVERPSSMIWMESQNKSGYKLQIDVGRPQVAGRERYIEQIFIYAKTKLNDSQISTILKNNLGIELRSNAAKTGEIPPPVQVPISH